MLFDPNAPARKGESNIQRTANQILVAADTQMDQVIALEAEHGKCLNFKQYSSEDVWIFEDKYQLRIKRE